MIMTRFYHFYGEAWSMRANVMYLQQFLTLSFSYLIFDRYVYL